jgi:hypothetical protein
MKTTKFFLIVALVSIAALTFSESFNDNPRFTVKITLNSAMENPALVRVMHEQLNSDFLIFGDETHYYTVQVRFRGTRYLVTGTLREWKYFFSASLDDPIPER